MALEIAANKLPAGGPQNHNCIYFGAYGDSPAKTRINCREGKGIVLLHNYIIVENAHIDSRGNNMLWLEAGERQFWIVSMIVSISPTVQYTQCAPSWS